MKKQYSAKLDRAKIAAFKAGKGIYRALPILVGMVLLIALANTLIPKSAYSSLFSGNFIFDPLIGASAGSILAGNPITSYVIGGELLTAGISMIAVIAFIVAWVTVGIVQLPAESMLLGKKFAFTRNIVAFLTSIGLAIVTVIISGLI